jgi:hypothetical protein
LLLSKYIEKDWEDWDSIITPIEEGLDKKRFFKPNNEESNSIR